MVYILNTYMYIHVPLCLPNQVHSSSSQVKGDRSSPVVFSNSGNMESEIKIKNITITSGEW